MKFLRSLGANMEGGDDFGRLVVMLRDRDFIAVSRAAEGLAKMGKEGHRGAVRALIDAMREGNEQTRTFSASALGRAGAEEAVGPLVGALGDENLEVRASAEESLAALGEAALGPLLDAMRAGGEAARFHAAAALSRMGDERGIRPLLEALVGEDEKVRWAGVYSLYSDHRQFYLQDAAATPDTGSPDFWSDEAFGRKFAPAEGLVGVGTERYGTVPVWVTIYSDEPPVRLEEHDHIAEASLAVPSGRILIDGCLALSPESPAIAVEPGEYRVRACLSGLDTVVDDGHGDDRYSLALWPQTFSPPRILKAWRASG